MAPRLFNLLYAISLLIILATFVSIPAHAKGEHAKIKSDVLELNWHDTLNSSSYEVLRGPGSAPLTPLTAPFGSIFVAHDSITERASDRHVGTGQGTFVISSFDGFTSFMSFTISLNYDKYLGSLTFVGLLNANATSKIPIVGGTEDFLFAQGYMLYTPPPPKDATTYTLTLTIDLHVYWPLSVSH